MMKMFPVMVGRYGCEKVWIPWHIVAPHEAQAQINHSQSLERLAERGGLSPLELYWVLSGTPWDLRETKCPQIGVWRQIWELLGHEQPKPFDTLSLDKKP